MTGPLLIIEAVLHRKALGPSGSLPVGPSSGPFLPPICSRAHVHSVSPSPGSFAESDSWRAMRRRNRSEGAGCFSTHAAHSCSEAQCAGDAPVGSSTAWVSAIAPQTGSCDHPVTGPMESGLIKPARSRDRRSHRTSCSPRSMIPPPADSASHSGDRRRLAWQPSVTASAPSSSIPTLGSTDCFAIFSISGIKPLPCSPPSSTASLCPFASTPATDETSQRFEGTAAVSITGGEPLGAIVRLLGVYAPVQL